MNLPGFRLRALIGRDKGRYAVNASGEVAGVYSKRETAGRRSLGIAIGIVDHASASTF
jgi:hypothetical protein